MQDWTPDQLKTELDAGSSVFLKLWKPGCGPCKLSESATERIESKLSGEHPEVKCAQISVESHPEMLEISNSEVLPCFFVFKDKAICGKHLGFKGLAKLEQFVIDSLAVEKN